MNKKQKDFMEETAMECLDIGGSRGDALTLAFHILNIIQTATTIEQVRKQKELMK